MLDEYYAWYKTQHTRPLNRRLHAFGSLLAPFVLLAFALGVAFVSPWLLLPMPFALFFCAYGPAWTGHFFVEHNAPATFTHPLKSLACDWRMLWEETHPSN